MTDPRTDARSTFALDVDTGSYTRFRDAVAQGQGVARDEIRTEEFVNYFRQDYEAPSDGLDVSIDAAVPFRPSHRIVRVGIASAAVSDRERRDADLVLVVDCSGSMREADKTGTTPRPPCAPSSAPCAAPTASRWSATRNRPTSPSTRPRCATATGSSTPLARARCARQSSMDAAEAALRTLVGYAAPDRPGRDGLLERCARVARRAATVGARPTPAASSSGSAARAARAQPHRRRREGLRRAPRAARRPRRRWHVYVGGEQEAERVFATGLAARCRRGRDAGVLRSSSAGVRSPATSLIGSRRRHGRPRTIRTSSVDGGEVFAGPGDGSATSTSTASRTAERPSFATGLYCSVELVRRRLADVECAEAHRSRPRRRLARLPPPRVLTRTASSPTATSGTTIRRRRRGLRRPRRRPPSTRSRCGTAPGATPLPCQATVRSPRPRAPSRRW